MPCPFCDLGICINPDHGVVRTYQPPPVKSTVGLLTWVPESKPVLIFDIRRRSSARVEIPTAKSPPSITVHGMPIQDYLRWKVTPVRLRIRVSAYAEAWEKDSQIVKDAQSIRVAWELKAKEKRGLVNWKSSKPPLHKCSGVGWEPVDEGMDVAREIADVDSQEGRTADGVTLWRAHSVTSVATVGILILEHAVLHFPGAELGIRWLVGHPTTRGAGSALMAKADEIHRKAEYKDSPMHVTAAASSVPWYESKGFERRRAATCNDEDTECGCVIMEKPAPG